MTIPYKDPVAFLVFLNLNTCTIEVKKCFAFLAIVIFSLFTDFLFNSLIIKIYLKVKKISQTDILKGARNRDQRPGIIRYSV